MWVFCCRNSGFCDIVLKRVDVLVSAGIKLATFNLELCETCGGWRPRSCFKLLLTCLIHVCFRGQPETQAEFTHKILCAPSLALSLWGSSPLSSHSDCPSHLLLVPQSRGTIGLPLGFSTLPPPQYGFLQSKAQKWEITPHGLILLGFKATLKPACSCLFSRTLKMLVLVFCS